VIKNVRYKDAGEYMCQVNSVPMVSQVSRSAEVTCFLPASSLVYGSRVSTGKNFSLVSNRIFAGGNLRSCHSTRDF
jgi:hypothetical protein